MKMNPINETNYAWISVVVPFSIFGCCCCCRLLIHLFHIYLSFLTLNFHSILFEILFSASNRFRVCRRSSSAAGKSIFRISPDEEFKSIVFDWDYVCVMLMMIRVWITTDPTKSNHSIRTITPATHKLEIFLPNEIQSFNCRLYCTLDACQTVFGFVSMMMIVDEPKVQRENFRECIKSSERETVAQTHKDTAIGHTFTRNSSINWICMKIEQR